MASIQKIKGINNTSYRVFIRHIGERPISKTFQTRQKALQFILQIEGNGEERLRFNRSTIIKITFSKLIKHYLDEEYTGQRPTEERRKLNFWADHLGHMFIINVTRMDIKQGLLSLPSKLSSATINRYKASVSAVFSYACRTYDLPDNPAKHISALPENNARTRFLSESERTLLLKACRHSEWPKLYLLVLLAITTGARKGELLNLKWSDINLERCTAHVATTKNGQPKVLPLTLNVIKEINRFADSEYSLIFHSKIKPEQPFRFYKTWKKVLKEADIKDFRFHDLRHTTASYLAQSGATLLEIADVLGHKQISVTQRYAHLCIEHKSKLINEVMSGL
jgi:integrase